MSDFTFHVCTLFKTASQFKIRKKILDVGFLKWDNFPTYGLPFKKKLRTKLCVLPPGSGHNISLSTTAPSPAWRSPPPPPSGDSVHFGVSVRRGVSAHIGTPAKIGWGLHIYVFRCFGVGVKAGRPAFAMS